MPLYFLKKLYDLREILFSLAIKLNAKTDKELIIFCKKKSDKQRRYAYFRNTKF